MHTIRASSAGTWSDCAMRAWYIHNQDTTTDEPKSLPVALAVGIEVHSRITGQAFTEPLRIEYDDATRSDLERKRQVEQITQEAIQQLKDCDLEAIETERYFSREIWSGEVGAVIEGHIDLICKHKKTNEIYFVDLKTGKSPPRASWLQLAVYYWLGKHNEYEANKCSVLWIPRTIKETQSKHYVKDGESLFSSANLLIRRIMQTISTGKPLPNPNSFSCKNCCVKDCPVRM